MSRKKKIGLSLIAIVVVGIAYVGYVNLRPAKPATAPPSLGEISQSNLEKGRYLAQMGDCVACHTVPGEAEFAGGVGLDTPFGTIYASNITPDKETGIGNWSDEEFIQAVKYGIGKGHQFLYPAMPYPAYAKASDEDIQLIHDYLKTIPAVKRENTANALKFPFSFRPLVLGWNTLFLDRDGFTPNEQKSEQWNRGAYLVEGLAHCGTCHTPKNIFGADKGDQAYMGLSLQGWFAPDITPNQSTGIGHWTESDFVEYLKTGVNQYAAASGPMGEAVSHSTQYFNDEDLKAMYQYLHDTRESTHQTIATAIPATDPDMLLGKALYHQDCTACHGLEGEGISEMTPGFAHNTHLQSDNVESIIRVILEGSQSPITQYNFTGASMPGFSWNLTDEQVAAVVTYLRNSWGNKGSRITVDEVAKVRATIGAREPLPR